MTNGQAKEITKNLLRATICETCFAYNIIHFRTLKDAEDLMRGFFCKLNIIVRDNGEFYVELPFDKGCKEWENWSGD